MHAAAALKALAFDTEDGHVAVQLDFSNVFAPRADGGGVAQRGRRLRAAVLLPAPLPRRARRRRAAARARGTPIK